MRLKLPVRIAAPLAEQTGVMRALTDHVLDAALAQLDAAWHFTGTANVEIAQRWYPLTVRSGYTKARPAIAEFLAHIGRRKLIMPTYEELVKTVEGLRLGFGPVLPGMALDRVLPPRRQLVTAIGGGVQ